MRRKVGSVTFPNNSALGPYVRVKLSGGYLVVAGAADDELGTLEHRALATDTLAAVVPREDPCSRLMIAAGVIAQYAEVYAAANGKVADSGTLIRGIALEAAAASGDAIEVLSLMASLIGTVPRTNLVEDALQPYTIPLAEARITETLVILGAAAGTPSGAFGLTPGVHGTNSPVIVGEAASGNIKTDKLRLSFALPPEYVAAGDVKIRIHAKLGALLTATSTIDVTVREADGEAGVSADLCATAAQTLTAAYADYDFVITATGLVAGDLLDIEIVGVANDTGGTVNDKIYIGGIKVLADVKG